MKSGTKKGDPKDRTINHRITCRQ